METKLRKPIELSERELRLFNDPKIQEGLKECLFTFISRDCNKLNIEINMDVSGEDISRMIIESCSYCEAMSILYHGALKMPLKELADKFGFSHRSVANATRYAMIKIVHKHRYALVHGLDKEKEWLAECERTRKLSLRNYLSPCVYNIIRNEYGISMINELYSMDFDDLINLKSILTQARYKQIEDAIRKYEEEMYESIINKS